MKKSNYSVLCGNIGQVYHGESIRQAKGAFRAYVSMSKTGSGRGGDEPVTMFCDDNIIKEYVPKANWFPVSEIKDLLVSLKKDIGDEYRAFEDDDKPGMQVTISTKDGSSWSYQTGDNSFTGDCYDDPHWAVISLYRNSNCLALAREAVSELKGMVSDSIV